jgi:hypothetical protein
MFAAKDVFAKDLLKPKELRGESVMYRFMLRTAQALHAKDESSQAHWVLDLGRSLLRRRFVIRYSGALRRDLIQPSSIRTFRRQATAAEVAKGVKIDADGAAIALRRPS